MKIQLNLTDCACDLDRFATREDLWKLLKGFDGLELMHLEEDARHLLTRDMVIGYHMSQPAYWLDFWNGDYKRCLDEFDTLEQAFICYGGKDRNALITAVRREYEQAVRFGAEYMVFHVSDASAFEEISGVYHHSDREVIQGVCELLNAALPQEEGPQLMLENMWQPGLTLLDPEMTQMLLQGIRYPKTGIMLDTGHLMHTEPALRSQKEAVRYIHQRLDAHGQLAEAIRGIHLNQSLTGRVLLRYRNHPPVPGATLEKRRNQLFGYVFQVDLHKPFVGEGVRELISRIDPDYMTYEFISNNLEEHKRMIRRQIRATGSSESHSFH